MCGRFVRHSSLRLIEETFNVDTVEAQMEASYNIAPTQPVLAVVRNGSNRLKPFHWGLVPFWSKDLSVAARLINARLETLAQKPSFRDAFRKRRCLVVADGFYEWKGAKGHKQPYYIKLPADGPFGFAGLWEHWKSRQGSSEYFSCTIITTESSFDLHGIHHRMPVILRPDGYDAWLDAANRDAAQLESLLRNHGRKKFRFYAVSTRVNRTANTDARCIEPRDRPFDENHPNA